jgi:hypothetical protein
MDQQRYQDDIDHDRRLEVSYPQDAKAEAARAWLDSLERGELPKGDER